MSKRKTAMVKVEAPAPVASFDFDDGEARVQDLELANWLGFEKPRNIRKLIARYWSEIQQLGFCSTVEQNTGKRGRPSTEYWLTQAQASFISGKSETPRANDVLAQMAIVFTRAMRGELAPVTPGAAADLDKAQDPVFAMLMERIGVIDKPPKGYFNVFKMLTSFMIDAIAAGLLVGAETIPDISVGRTWSDYWEVNKLEETFGARIRCRHTYPPSYPQAQAGPQPMWAYPLAAMGSYTEWFEEVYLPLKFPNYVKNKVRDGRLQQRTANRLLDKFSPPQLPAPAPAPVLATVRPGPAKALGRVPSRTPKRSSGP